MKKKKNECILNIFCSVIVAFKFFIVFLPTGFFGTIDRCYNKDTAIWHCQCKGDNTVKSYRYYRQK